MSTYSMYYTLILRDLRHTKAIRARGTLSKLYWVQYVLCRQSVDTESPLTAVSAVTCQNKLAKQPVNGSKWTVVS